MKCILTLALMGLLFSCSNELDLLEPGPKVPVVYALISPQDSIHKVRLTHTFDGSYTPEEDAKNADSLFYNEAEVKLELRSEDGKVLERIYLEETFFEDREPGIFACSPNILFSNGSYQIRQPFDRKIAMVYHLTVTLPEFDKSIFATASVPSTPHISTNIYEGEELNIYNHFSRPKGVQFSPDAEFVSELHIEFFYENQVEGQWQQESFLYKRSAAPTSGMIYKDSIQFKPDWLFQQFAGRIKDNPDVAKRKFKSVEIRSMLISPEYHYYSTSMEFAPDYYSNIFSNIVNGKGLFAAYSISEMKGITFGQQMLDSLALGRLTRHLSFERRW